MTDLFDRTPLRQYPYRWRLSRAGFVNVWHYYENTFDISGGRLILRGSNGSGKSRALEMLLPFLLDADRRNMGTGSSVKMEDLMSAGAGEQTNRLGYMWLELRCDEESAESGDPVTRFLTLGALVRFAVSTKEAKVWYFTTPLRVGAGLPLLGADRQPLSRRDLADLVTEERITDVADKHRERVRAEVFGLTGQLGRERFDGLTKLLHTLRSPDVGNRIEEGRLPAILADALPPLSEEALTDAGQQLDGLTSTREDQQRLEAARDQVRTFLDAYRKYVTGVLATSLRDLRFDAEQARRAADDARERANRAAQLEEQLAADTLRLEERNQQAEGLEARLDGLRDSDDYRSGQELGQLGAVVNARAGEADTALKAADGARREEERRVADTAILAGDVERAAGRISATLRDTRKRLATAGITDHELPTEVRADRRPGPGTPRTVRTSRLAEPDILDTPVPDVLALEPANLDFLTDAAQRTGQLARTRAAQAGNRAIEARSLKEQRREADQAADKASEVEERATEATSDAEQAAEDRDDAALALVDRWRNWIESHTTAELLGPVNWASVPALRRIITDRTALCGEGTDVADLQELDGAADDAVSDATAHVDRALERLRDADHLAQQQAEALTVEQARLLAEHDPEPEAPGWVTGTDGVPLWRCLDFAEAADADLRAGLEAGLLASGLLTATVDSTGRLVATTGHLLLTPVRERVPVPLSTVLVVDPASPLPAAAVQAVLDRIGLDDPTVTTWIGGDGSWGNGALRGRHTVPAARHIGAAARAAARAARLFDIERDLKRLADEAELRQAERIDLQSRRTALRDHHRTAPRSAALTQARTLAQERARQAARTAADAVRLRATADQLSRAWAEKDREHRLACAEFGLPADEDSLRALQEAARSAADNCATVTEEAKDVAQFMQRYADSVTAVTKLAGRRVEAEKHAAAAWQSWQNDETRLRALTEAVGTAAAEVQRQVMDAETQLRKIRNAIREGTVALQNLSRDAGTAGSEAETAATRAGERRTGLGRRVTAVLDQLNQPGIVDTAFTAAPGDVFTDLAPEAVAAESAAVAAALRAGRSDENALFRAQQAFEREISGSYDVAATVVAGIRLFELIDADGRRPLALAAMEIERQCEVGRAALTEREHQVFHRFVLGEVGEELRRRLGQATTLITAMNASLKSIRTSHGIGVRLTWKSAEEAGSDIVQIKTLVSTAAAVRTAAQDTELTDLLSSRVAAEATKDPTAGYAVHLRAALDYRAWHTVEVIITGPEEGRERRISRRAKLSQGETRFVSYVTLFAAVDAYLSGLENTDTALRLILLDDAFAKVDEQTIAELLGLLVRLDVDFAMTGHALWGCVPQVPSLDIYEICREEGTPAATAHVHWDGRTRHFLRAA
ncbi:TIGR02680 family protein [Micromonospora sp. NBC_00898]|uniref:TIGR02680 family protein n=1 Tax=Micromonospora sp. NBC_00898 TaxID=2975981 RepID=UPI00386FF6B7|nr:TIGR02680 family protein [Micromonospora sp. NBC_00898]